MRLNCAWARARRKPTSFAICLTSLLRKKLIVLLGSAATTKPGAHIDSSDSPSGILGNCRPDCRSAVGTLRDAHEEYRASLQDSGCVVDSRRADGRGQNLPGGLAKSPARPVLHLHVQPCIQSGSAGPHS